MQTRSSPSLVALHSLAREAQLEKYEQLPKQDLYIRLKEQYNYDRLQRAQRFSHKRKNLETEFDAENTSDTENQRQGRNRSVHARTESSVKYNKKRKGGLNKLDPIMFTKIGKYKYKFVRPNGKVIQYNVESLVEYLLSTGDFHEPETRIRFSENDLRQIDEAVRSYGLNKPSVFEAKQNNFAYAEKRQQRDALLGLERCASEVVAEMMQIIELDDPDLAEEGEMKLVMSTFPIFSDLFGQIMSVDQEYAGHCMAHFISFLRGPPNRPTVDRLGFLQIILDFLNRISCGKQPDFGF
mmetsp:Transcript_16014/g.21168  ORF Transcript_16014/g.21168 Transcript_16014/m.21168 type:complete len:296 (+) Transcript_16014:147-1034(+)